MGRLDGETVRGQVERLLRGDPAFGLGDHAPLHHEDQDLVPSRDGRFRVLQQGRSSSGRRECRPAAPLRPESGRWPFLPK